MSLYYIIYINMSFSRLFGKRQQPQQIEDNYNISEPFAIKKSNETVLDDGNSLSLVNGRFDNSGIRNFSPDYAYNTSIKNDQDALYASRRVPTSYGGKRRRTRRRRKMSKSRKMRKSRKIHF